MTLRALSARPWCEDDDVSCDASSGRYGEHGGAMTTAFCEVLRHHAAAGSRAYCQPHSPRHSEPSFVNVNGIL